MRLFTFEGIDGSGKTTCLDALKQIFSVTEYEQDVKFTAAKDHKLLQEELFRKNSNPPKESYIHYWWLARILQISEWKNDPKLNIILSDRYYDSTFAYQELMHGPEYLIKHTFNPTYFIKPDLTFYFKIDPQIALDRLIKLNSDNDLFEDKKLETLIKINKAYEFLYSSSYVEDRNVFTIDASQDVDTVIGTVAGVIFKYIDFGVFDGQFSENS